MDLISVIVPIYKAEEFLERCLKSIIAQTYRNLQIILVDDGSPDRCPQLCDDWAVIEERVVVIHQPNRGVSAARNSGILRADGSFIVMIDSDDYISENMIEILYRVLTDTEADMSICNFEYGSKLNHLFTPCQEPEVIEKIDAETALERMYQGDKMALQYVAPWGKLYSKKLFKDIQYPENKIFEDIYVTHQLLYKCQSIAVVDEKLLYYYQHPDSIMNCGFHKGKLDYLSAIQQRVEFFHIHNMKTLEKIAYEEYLHSLIWEYSRTRDILHDKQEMKSISFKFRSSYRRGYSSSRYPKENAFFLAVFRFNPELIIAYWKVKGKLNKLHNRGIQNGKGIG